MTIEGWGIIIYTIVVVGIALAYTKVSQKSSESFFLSNRKNPTIFLIAGHVLGRVGAGSLVGVYGTAYSKGISAAIWYPLGFSLAFFFFGWTLSKGLKRLGDKWGIYTIGEIFERRFNKKVSVTFAVLSILKNCNYTAGQFTAGAIVMELFMGVPVFWGCIFSAIIITGYCMAGGLSGTLANSVVQLVVTFLGLIIAVGLGIKMSGGLGNLMASIPEGWDPNIFGNLSAVTISGLVLPTFLSCYSNVGMVARSFSAKDERTSYSSNMWSGVLSCAICVFTVIASYVIVVHVPNLKSGSYALMSLFSRVLPFGGAIFAGSILAACMSTAEECILGPAAMFCRDIYKANINPKATDKQVMIVNRIFMTAFGMLACYFSIRTESLLDLMIFASNMLSCSFPVFFAAYYWNRFNAEGALVGLIAGGATALLWMFVPSLRSIMPTLWAGVIVTTVTMVPVTFLTKPPSKENLRFIKVFQDPDYDPDSQEEAPVTA